VWRKYLSHATFLIGNIKVKSGDISLLYFCISSYYSSIGAYKKGEAHAKRSADMREHLYGQEHPSTLTAMAHLASTYWSQGRRKEAKELEVQVLEIEKRVLGQQHPSTLNTIANLTTTWSKLGRPNIATVLFMFKNVFIGLVLVLFVFLSFQNLFYFWRGSLEAGKGHRYRLARIV
jgi:hypothetical protein